MKWFIETWKDKGYRTMTYALTIGSIVFDIAISILDQRVTINAIPIGFGVFFISILIAYLKRNDP